MLREAGPSTDRGFRALQPLASRVAAVKRYRSLASEGPAVVDVDSYDREELRLALLLFPFGVSCELHGSRTTVHEVHPSRHPAPGGARREPAEAIVPRPI
jgi:hypothetical protein